MQSNHGIGGNGNYYRSSRCYDEFDLGGMAVVVKEDDRTRLTDRQIDARHRSHQGHYVKFAKLLDRFVHSM